MKAHVKLPSFVNKLAADNDARNSLKLMNLDDFRLTSVIFKINK